MTKSVLDLIEQEKEKQPEQIAKSYFDIDKHIAKQDRQEKIDTQMSKTKFFLLRYADDDQKNKINNWLCRSYLKIEEGKKIFYTEKRCYSDVKKHSTLFKESGIDEIKPIEKNS